MKPRGRTVRRAVSLDDMRDRSRNQALLVRAKKRDMAFASKRFRSSESLAADAILTDDTALDVVLKDIEAGLSTSRTHPELAMGNIKKLRVILSRQPPPTGAVVDLNIRNDLATLLQSSPPSVQAEIAWCITNMAAGGHEATLHVLPLASLLLDMISAALVRLESLTQPQIITGEGSGASIGGSTTTRDIVLELELIRQGWWALGNMAGDGDECRTYLLTSLPTLEASIATLRRCQAVLAGSSERSSNNDSSNGSSSSGGCDDVCGGAWQLCRSTAWTLSNLARGHSPLCAFFDTGAVALCIDLARCNDAGTRQEVMWMLAFLTAKDDIRVADLLTQHALHEILCEAAHGCDVTSPADGAILRALGNLSTGPDEWLDSLLEQSSLLPVLCRVVATDDAAHATVRDAVWVAANLLGAAPRHRTAVLSTALLPLIVDKVLPCGVFQLQREAVFAVREALREVAILRSPQEGPWSAGSAQTAQLLKEANVIRDIVRLAEGHDVEVTLACLHVLRELAGSSKELRIRCVDVGVTDLLDSLEYSTGNPEVQRLASIMAEEMYENDSDELEDISLRPMTASGGTHFEFGGASSHAQPSVFDFGAGSEGRDGDGVNAPSGGGRGRGRGLQLPSWMTDPQSGATGAAPSPLGGAVRNVPM